MLYNRSTITYLRIYWIISLDINMLFGFDWAFVNIWTEKLQYIVNEWRHES